MLSLTGNMLSNLVFLLKSMEVLERLPRVRRFGVRGVIGWFFIRGKGLFGVGKFRTFFSYGDGDENGPLFDDELTCLFLEFDGPCWLVEHCLF